METRGRLWICWRTDGHVNVRGLMVLAARMRDLRDVGPDVYRVWAVGSRLRAAMNVQ